jgi:Fe-S cluster assembly protein NifU
MAWDYTEKLKDHFRNPRNVLMGDEDAFTADGVGEVGNEQCGDIMKMWVVVRDGRLADCKWKTYGCASAIGSTSVLSEMVIGKTLDEALSVTPADIQNELGGLPDAKIHCSVLGDKALRAAIYDYFRRTDQIHRIPTEGEIICECLRVTKAEIRQCVNDGLTTLEDVQARTKAGTACGGCLEGIRRAIEEAKLSGGGHH